MRINNISRDKTNFAGFLNNKYLLKSLEKVSDHGTSFAAGTSLVMSLTARPLAIFSTPDVEKENKQYAAANSICSGIVKFGLVEAVALPVEKAVKNIDEHSEKYLKPEAIKNLQGKSSKLIESRAYRLATQILKLDTGFLTAIPKSILTIAFIPIIMDNIFKKSDNYKKINENKNKKISFEGDMTSRISSQLSKVLNNQHFQNFVKKHELNDKNIAKHMTAATDILLTSTFAVQTSKSKNIKENRKKALVYNNIISTVITLAGGYFVDNAIKSKTGKFIDKFSKINASDPKLHKYIEGINIVRPALIFAGIYYGILPIFSTYIAEKVDKYIEQH